MALFKDMLASGESLFKNRDALDFEFVPKLMPYREMQQKRVAHCIAPLLQDQNGRNLLIHGPSGIGKTAAIKWVFRDLEDETDAVEVFYINCWQKNTTFKILTDLCHQMGYMFTQNKKTEELMAEVEKIVNKRSAVFCFDEIDKAEDFDFLYSLLESIHKKTVILITNYKETIAALDSRITSRLTPEVLEFKQYTPQETHGILKERIGYAFVPGVWSDDAFKIVADKCADLKDIRSGLYLLREAGLSAEEVSSKKIMPDHASAAVSKLDEFTIKSTEELADEKQRVLSIVKEFSGAKIGDLFKHYQEKGGRATYRTFQRTIERLAQGKFIVAEKTQGGSEGNTTIVKAIDHKKLTEF